MIFRRSTIAAAHIFAQDKIPPLMRVLIQKDLKCDARHMLPPESLDHESSTTLAHQFLAGEFVVLRGEFVVLRGEFVVLRYGVVPCWVLRFATFLTAGGVPSPFSA